MKTPPALSPETPQETQDSYTKSPSTAFLLSMGVTLASYPLFFGGLEVTRREGFPQFGLGKAMSFAGIAGMAIGPSAGHIYTGSYGHTALFSGIRATSVGIITLGVLAGQGSIDAPSTVASATIILLGVSALGSFTFADLIDAPFSARRQERKKKSRLSFNLSPAPLRGTDGAATFGLLASGSF